jgi:truncated hemoglobin YjbI
MLCMVQRRGALWERGEIMGAHSIGSEEGPVVAAETPSLYERLGGVYAIAVVVDDFIDRIMVDPRLNANPRVDEAHHRVSAQGFKYYVTEQVCWAAGGPQTYSGRTMLDAHRELLISGAEWERSWTTSTRPSRISACPSASAASSTRSSRARRATS